MKMWDIESKLMEEIRAGSGPRRTWATPKGPCFEGVHHCICVCILLLLYGLKKLSDRERKMHLIGKEKGIDRSSRFHNVCLFVRRLGRLPASLRGCTFDDPPWPHERCVCSGDHPGHESVSLIAHSLKVIWTLSVCLHILPSALVLLDQLIWLLLQF